MGANELNGLHEHAGGAAAGIVDAPLVGLQHLDQEPDDAARRVELTGTPSLRTRKLRKEVLVDPAKHVPRPRVLTADLNVADQIDELAQAGFVQGRPSVILGQHALELQDIALDGGHGVVHQLADGRLFGLPFQMVPARLRRYPENVLRTVFVRVLGIGALLLLPGQAGVDLLEGVRDALRKIRPRPRACTRPRPWSHAGRRPSSRARLRSPRLRRFLPPSSIQELWPLDLHEAYRSARDPVR